MLALAWAAGAGPGDSPLTIDLDSTICETYGLAKEGARHHGYTGTRGYHPLLAIAAGTGEVLMSRRAAEVKVMVDEFPQAQVPGEGGWQEQAAIGHQAMVVKEDAYGRDYSVAASIRLRKKGVSVKLPCKLSPELDDIRPKCVLRSRKLLFSW